MSYNIFHDIFEIDYKVVGQDIRLYTPHNDQSVEIIQTWSKGGHFMVKDNIFPIEAGSVFLINAIENHFSHPQNRDSYIRSKLIVSKTFFIELMQILGVKEIIWDYLEANGGLLFELPAGSEVVNSIDRQFKYAANIYKENTINPQYMGSLTKAQIAVHLTQILLHLFTVTPTETPNVSRPQKTLSSITEYINEHMSNCSSLSLDEMAKDLHISRSHISHLFKEATGQSVMQFVSERRIAEAKKMLIDTDMKIQEISDLLNYSNSTVFCKTFKKIVGRTPNEYRYRERNK